VTVTHEIRGHLPASWLTVADVADIDLDVPYEIQDGALLLMTPPSGWHEAVSHDIRAYLSRRHTYAAQELMIAVGANGRRPDVVGITMTRTEVVGSRIRTLPADVVEAAVEVISHDSTSEVKDRAAVAQDREVKFREYAAAGIPEYWIVDEVADDPLDASVEIYRLQNGGYVPARVVRLSQLISDDS
jgi:Uma2 family endonuclease